MIFLPPWISLFHQKFKDKKHFFFLKTIIFYSNLVPDFLSLSIYIFEIFQFKKKKKKFRFLFNFSLIFYYFLSIIWVNIINNFIILVFYVLCNLIFTGLQIIASVEWIYRTPSQKANLLFVIICFILFL